MDLVTEPYLMQLARWPERGRYILAHYDSESVIVYQAYHPTIGHFAAEHGYFGGEFSLSRMSWIKPGFLWMMYRSGWATRPGQEVVLAIRLRRTAFDEILSQAVHSTYLEAIYGARATWQEVVASSSVLLQWDPDHGPTGARVERRAIQLGLRDSSLARYASDWILDIEDITPFVHQQHLHARRQNFEQLVTPREIIYPVSDPRVVAKLGMNSPG